MQTLPVNIQNTSSYPNREFIILNYGSRDGLHEWVQTNLRSWIDSGIVKYYRTKKPKFFVATHAKNIAHRQATGDILCNVDADNYLMEGFSEYLVEKLTGKTIVAAPPTDNFGIAGSCGKIAVLKEHFYSVNGYDEGQNLGWGWDDTNFQFRCRMQNDLEYICSDKKWCVAIHHSNEERTRNFCIKDIYEGRDISEKRLIDIAIRKDYIANKDENWGYIEDLSVDIS